MHHFSIIIRIEHEINFWTCILNIPFNCSFKKIIFVIGHMHLSTTSSPTSIFFCVKADYYSISITILLWSHLSYISPCYKSPYTRWCIFTFTRHTVTVPAIWRTNKLGYISMLHHFKSLCNCCWPSCNVTFSPASFPMNELILGMVWNKEIIMIYLHHLSLHFHPSQLLLKAPTSPAKCKTVWPYLLSVPCHALNGQNMETCFLR